MADRPLPAYSGDEPYIFVAYSHEDSDLVYPQIRWLQDQGFNIAWDEGISPGAVWRREVAEAIRGCSLLLYFTTPNSVASEHCTREVNFALDEHHRPVLAVHLVETTLPDALALSLSDRQAILQHTLEPADYERKLVSAVATYLDQPVPEVSHTRSGAFRPSTVKRRVALLAAVVCVVVGLALGWIGAQWWPGGTPTNEVSRYRYGLPQEEPMVATLGVSIAISPDGGRIAYVGPGEGSTQIWIRERDQLRGKPIPGTEGAWHPLFAPRGPGVGFVTGDGKLNVVGRVGDPPLTLADDAWNLFGAAWAPDGYIYYATREGLKRVTTGGGSAPELVVALDPEIEGVVAHAYPDVLPNGNGVLFSIVRNHVPSDVAVLDLSTGEHRVLVRGIIGRYAASGYLVYVREDGSLMTVPFDPDRLELLGSGVAGVDRLPAGLFPDLALSQNGRLIYATRPERILELVWVDRDGTWLSIDPDNPIRDVRYAVLSPDGTRLAVNIWNRPPSDDGQLWIKQLPQGAFFRLTFDGTVNMRPTWTPDGESIMYISDRGGNRDVWVKQVDGIKDAELRLDYAMDIDEAFYSPDGEWVVHRRGMQSGERDILAIRPQLDTEPTPLLTSSFDELAPALSPDGRWLAYVSNRAGQPNVYVRPFPSADTETIVSANGGTEPVWAPDGSELFYRNGASEMVAVEVRAASEFKLGDAQVLFATDPYRADLYHAAYDVTADGRQFVMIRETESGSSQEELVVVENWFQELGTIDAR